MMKGKDNWRFLKDYNIQFAVNNTIGNYVKLIINKILHALRINNKNAIQIIPDFRTELFLNLATKE